ncbi:MAG: hypothetical protein JRI23_30870 [Deltaproteobacteria bacterium]|jgi:hypothetical protein|nr:hypothetical protein [Deltaproteobacteria bacterium]MBW2536601.1 hypothetical protein [Deltaproteobacteria bacterium]
MACGDDDSGSSTTVDNSVDAGDAPGDSGTVEPDAHLDASPIGPLEDPPDSTERIFDSRFETGAIQAGNSAPDGWLEQTMRSNCPGNDYCVPGSDYSYSSQVLTSANDEGVGLILPRYGDYFWRAEIRHGDNPLNGDHSPRSQLKVSTGLPNAHIEWGVRHWVQWSLYKSSVRAEPEWNEDLTLVQMSFYPDPTDTLGLSQIAFQFEYVPPTRAANIGWPSDGYKVIARYWDMSDPQNPVQDYVAHADLGATNLIPSYVDEWVDWRLEIRSHASSGIIKLWQRRSSADNQWVQVISVTGVAVGAPNRDYLASISTYGGPHDYTPGEEERFNPSIIGYFDEVGIFK